MRRLVLLVFLMAMASLVFTGSASADQPVRVHNTLAFALWSSPCTSPCGEIDTSVSAVHSMREGDSLAVRQDIASVDSSGNFTGNVEITAEATSGFSLTIMHLESAHVSASDLPATECSYNADHNLIGCTETTIDVDVTWTGQGPIMFPPEGRRSHSVNAFRDAIATGTVAGVTLTADDLLEAHLVTANFSFDLHRLLAEGMGRGRYTSLIVLKPSKPPGCGSRQDPLDSV